MSTPHKTRWFEAVNAQMAAGHDTFNNAWSLCKCRHPGLFAAYEAEGKPAGSVDAVNSANDRDSGLSASRLHAINAAVKERQDKMGEVYHVAFVAVKRTQPALFNGIG